MPTDKKKKKPSKKSEPKAKPGILDILKDNDVNVIKSSCLINQLYMKADLRWKLDLNVRMILPRSYYQYDLKLVFDDEPYEGRHAALQDKINKLESESALFPNKAELKELREQMEFNLGDQKIKKENCPTIGFFCTVDTLQYKDNTSIIKLDIPDTIIDLLNKSKHWFNYYRLELRPQEIQIHD